jgi:hypothetical protein
VMTALLSMSWFHQVGIGILAHSRGRR